MISFGFVYVDALHGIKDLLKHHPAELLSNKYATTHKLRELITDDDKLVRDDFYTLLTGIFLACKEVCVPFFFLLFLLTLVSLTLLC